MMTRYDPWVNLMRTTVAAFAAGIGGADAVTVLPFDAALGVPEALGRRLARNISSLLISEAHVAEVADPAAGAYAVEMLTAQIADAAWAEFARIERDGGISQVVDDGSLHARWASTARERRVRIAHSPDSDHRGERVPAPRRGAAAAHAARAGRARRALGRPNSKICAITRPPHPCSWRPWARWPSTRPGPRSPRTCSPRAGWTPSPPVPPAAPRTSSTPTGRPTHRLPAWPEPTPPTAISVAEVIAALRAAGARWVVLAGRPAGRPPNWPS